MHLLGTNPNAQQDGTAGSSFDGKGFCAASVAATASPIFHPTEAMPISS
jgi:hypothetical protein